MSGPTCDDMGTVCGEEEVASTDVWIEESVRALWNAEGKSLMNDCVRVSLLKRIVDRTGEIFQRDVLQAVSEEATPDAATLRRVVLESNLQGLEEFSPVWRACISAKMQRMKLCAQFCALAMEQGESTGFDAFERAIIAASAKITVAYNMYYFAFLDTVQAKDFKARLEQIPATDKALHSHYTILRPEEDGWSHVSFAEHFEEVLTPVLAAMDSAVADVQAAATTPEQLAYVKFFRQYRASLAERSIEELEPSWKELDRCWMDTRLGIQVVHDIETGYGDPMRVKATPDYSMRLLDDTFAKENQAIADIQARMVKYFEGRGTDLARKGLRALSNTFCGIYFIPFKTGISLQFSFSGQSIPNRGDVKEEKGVKIYFDAVETEARVAQNKLHIGRLFHDADTAVLAKYRPDAVETLVWHVAAHEVGHAIYNLESQSFSDPAIQSLLEEPRAELTAMFTLRLLHREGVLDEAELGRHLAAFALDALRYFAKYTSEALRPYIIFQIYAYKVYAKHGYLSHTPEGLLLIDSSKTLPVLEEFSATFERILDAEDRADSAVLEKILREEMEPETDFVKKVVAAVNA